MESYVVALSPLLLALTALIVVFPIGLYYARLERDQHRARAAAQPIVSTYTIPASSIYVGPVLSASAFSYGGGYVWGGTSITVEGSAGQSQTAPTATQAPEQPLPKAA